MQSSSGERGSRAPRRDALRNDASVVAAARAAFAESGPNVSVETIAARAGVGVGTIYRRFSGKDALLDAVAKVFADELEEAAARAAAAESPAEGLMTFLEFVGMFTAEKRWYAAALAARVATASDSDATAEHVRKITRHAVEAGFLAPDISASDIKALITAVNGVVTATRNDDDVSWRRFLDIHLLGLQNRSRGSAPDAG